jgi:hypothetical protein
MRLKEAKSLRELVEGIDEVLRGLKAPLDVPSIFKNEKIKSTVIASPNLPVSYEERFKTMHEHI